jgi:hypothetical protein
VAIEYRKLVVEVRSAEGGGFRAKVVEAPVGGHPEGVFELPPAAAEPERLAPEVERWVRSRAETWRVAPPAGAGAAGVEVGAVILGVAGAGSEGGPTGSGEVGGDAAGAGSGTGASSPAAGVATGPVAAASAAAGGPEPAGWEALGRALYEALFAGERGRLLERSLDYRPRRSAGGTPGVAVTVRLGWQDPELRRLAAVPWELLRREVDGAFLCRRPDAPVVRDFDVSAPIESLAVAPPLRVLVAEARPRGLHALDLAREATRIRRGLRRARQNGAARAAARVEVRWLERATLAGLARRLAREPFHVVHFMGHGGFDDLADDRPVVVFETADGGQHRVASDELADLLKIHLEGELRLVVLNSCSSAEMPRRAGADPFTALAPELVRHGVPAVVATQYTVSDRAAVAFSGGFYGAVAEGRSLEEAVTAGRLAILADGGSPEWVTPTLYLHARDGRLLPPAERATGAEEGSQAGAPAVRRAAPRSRKRLRVAVYTSEVWAERLAPEVDRRISLADLFTGRDDRELVPGRSWDGDVFPRLAAALGEVARERRPLRLDLAAHQSVAFAAGWVLEAKSGLDVEVRQRTQGGPGRPPGWFDLFPGDGSSAEGRPWQEEPDLPGTGAGPDVAVAVSVTHPVLDEVRRHLVCERLGVARIVPATVEPYPHQTAVLGGDHALELAHLLVHRARVRRPAERGGTLHLFISAPNAFLFYLGQIARALGRLRLYEYDFGAADPCYRPSFGFPPAAG